MAPGAGLGWGDGVVGTVHMFWVVFWTLEWLGSGCLRVVILLDVFFGFKGVLTSM